MHHGYVVIFPLANHGMQMELTGDQIRKVTQRVINFTALYFTTLPGVIPLFYEYFY